MHMQAFNWRHWPCCSARGRLVSHFEVKIMMLVVALFAFMLGFVGIVVEGDNRIQ